MKKAPNIKIIEIAKNNKLTLTSIKKVTWPLKVNDLYNTSKWDKKRKQNPYKSSFILAFSEFSETGLLAGARTCSFRFLFIQP